MTNVRFGMLGPLEVVADGVSLRLGGARQERLLAVVLLEADRVVPMARLIDELWDDSPPRTAKTQVHKAVLGLRQLLGAGTLVSDPAGYRLRLGAAGLDTREFADLTERADRAAAADRLAEAVASARSGLRLWRGPALAGVTGPAVRAAAHRLDEQRLALLERCLDWEVALGHDVRAELAELVAQHPLQERFRAQLMTALHRTGRQADAIAVYDEGRRVLADELGLDPGPELRAVHEKVLGHTAPTAAAAVPATRQAPRTLPYDVPDFTGRPDECRWLLELGAATRAMTICTIEGMAGVGKTTLAVHAAHALAPRYPDGQLFIDLHGFTPGRPPTSPGAALELLLRAIGLPGERIPFTTDERVAVWRTELAGRRMLVVLDNAADAAQVAPLIPGGPRVLVLITSRRRVTELAGSIPLELDALPEQDAVALVTTIIGSERAAGEPAAVAKLVALCGFLPLAIRIAATRLQRHPRWSVTWLVDRLATEQRRLAELAVDTQHGVAAAFALSYQAIPPDQQRLFRLLGLHPGADIDANAAAALTGQAAEHTERLLARLVDEHLLHEPIPGRFTCHDLLRAHARQSAETEEPAPARHEALTRLLDHYRLSAAHAVDLIYPHDRNRRPHVRRPVGFQAPFAGTEAAARAWLAREIPNLVTAGTQPDRPAHSRDLSGVLAAYLEYHARHSDAKTLHTAARAAARTGADEAAALRNLGRINLYLGELDRASEQFAEALRLFGEHGDRLGEVMVMNDLAIIRTETGRYTEANDLCLRALEICADTGDDVGRMRLLGTLGNSYGHLGRYADSETQLHGSLRLARKLGHRDHESTAHLNIGDLYTKTRRYDAAIAHLESSRALSRERGNIEEAMARANLGGVFIQLGRYDEATDHLEPALAFFQEVGNHRWQGAVLRQLGTLYAKTGHHEKAATHLREALKLAQRIGMPSTEAEIVNRLGETARKLGDLELARNHHHAALAIARTTGQRHDEANAHLGLGHVHHEVGEPIEARRHWRLSLALYTELNVPDTNDVHHLLENVAVHLA